MCFKHELLVGGQLGGHQVIAIQATEHGSHWIEYFAR